MKTKILSAALGLTALASAQGAAAQQACVAPDDVADTVSYAVPMLYKSLNAPCSSVFAQNAFMANKAGEFVEQFRARQDTTWPGTLRLLKVFMAQQAGDGDAMAEAVAQMPDDALRPLVDVIIGQMVQDRLLKDVTATTCSDIAEAMELIAPLPPENIGGLASFIAKQADLKNPPVCGTSQATKAAGTPAAAAAGAK